MKGLNWNGIIKSPCSVSLLNEALLGVVRVRDIKRTIGVRIGDKSWFHDRCGLSHRVKQRSHRGWSRIKTLADWEEYRLACCPDQLV